MKRILKRVNRGVVLGVLLLLVFVIYVIADTVNFRNSKPELKETVDTFMTEMAQGMITPEQCRSIDKSSFTMENFQTITAAVRETCQKRMTFATSAYATEVSYYYGKNQNEILDLFNSLQTFYEDTGTRGVGYLTDCMAKGNRSSYSYQKVGVELARVYATYQMDMTYAGNPIILLPGVVIAADDYNHSSRFDEEGETLTDELKSMTVSVRFEFTLKQVDGIWQIAYIDVLGWDSDGGQGGSVDYVVEGGE